ncbi:hypothetical protein RhiirB3_528991 [Rhizophagus irregularis]|nr:hypothetical protein RhiirB3_528991 [Rhizophagus irregularis]
MELISTNGKNSFDPTPRLKSNPVPILFIPFNISENKCEYCYNEYSQTLSSQQYCKNCLFDYVNNLTDNNIYLDVIYEIVDRCIEHKDSNTQNIQEWCNNCSEISHFNQIAAGYHNTKCKLCKLCEKVYNGLCSNCYFISFEWIESTLVKNPIPIVYLPWWDYSSVCIACSKNLSYISDCQKWCSCCYTIYTGCRYCLTTNIIFGSTEQSKCRKCKRVIDIDVTGIDEYNFKKFTCRIITNNNIVNWVNKIKQGSNLMYSVYKYKLNLELFQNPNNHSYPIKANRQIRFISFCNNMDRCNYCGFSYSSTIFFKQKYCKYCLYLYHKDLRDKNVCLDVHINNTSNYHCTEHESKNIESYAQNIQGWCMNCSEILYFKQIVTKYSFDVNYYYERQNEIIKCEKDCTLCGQQNLLINTEFSLCSKCYLISFEWIESTLTEKTILILYLLSWWYNNEHCIVCKHILNDISSKASDDCQKWCSNCFTIYIGCRYCLATNIIFGLTSQSKCKKCERISFITIDTENIMENFIVSTNINANNYNQIVNYINSNKISNALKIYSFISKLKVFDLKYISYSNLENSEECSMPIIFVPYFNNSNKCCYCGNIYSPTLLFEQKYCKYCLIWYNKFTKFTITINVLDIYIITSNTQCTEHDKPRNLDFCTQNIQEWCINCSEVSYFKQIITQYPIDMEKQSEMVQNENCNLYGNLIYQQISFMCLDYYSISSGYIESTLIKKNIPILYLPSWDTSNNCITCKQNLQVKSECQKWCSNCFIIYNGCRYCLTTNIIFGLTSQSKCKKCERISFITIDTEKITENFIVSAKVNANNYNQIVNYVNSNKNSNVLKIYNFISELKFFDLRYIIYSNLENNEEFSIPIIFVPFNNDDSNICCHCENSYSFTLLFKQKYCKYCLYWYIKFTTQNMVDVYIITNSNTKCTGHEPRNSDFCTQNIQEWCINCSEISYFKQIITQHLFEMKEQSKVIQSENCNLCGNLINQQISFMCLDCYSVSSGYIESISIKKKIPILYLPWWDTSGNCIACEQSFEYKSNYQKWCLHCFIIYNSCRYCLTTNIIFGFTNQSQCIKCKRVEPISINGNYNIDELLNSTIETNDEIAKYMNNTDDPLKIYEFIKNKVKVSCKNIKMIEYSETEDFERIAEGGFGIIYKATWNKNGIVAVKKFLNSQDISKDFINELKPFIQYRNRFEHIIKYYGITQDHNTKDHMIIMQYADGGDLHKYLQNNFKNITWEDKLTILLEISRGVDCIHNENFIHRDLHSGNILLVNGKWHIGDLGLSRPANVTSSNDKIYGVIPYVAPEIFNGNKISKESDIYSFGIIMWELTAGCRPFAGIDFDTDLIYKIIDGKRPEITDDTPKCFADLMKKCWESDSSKRPHIKEIRKTIALWRYAIKNIFHSHINLEDADEFNQAEIIRFGPMKINELDPRFAVNSHPGAIYTSRLLNPLIPESLSISLSSSTLFNKKQEYTSKDLEFDINNVKRSSLSELNSTTQNSVNNNIQCSNAIYTSRPLNEILPIKQEYSSREIELDINDAQWSPLPGVNSTVQNSLYKIAEIKTETQNNEKLVLQDDLGTGLQLKSQDQIICRDGHTTSINNANWCFGRKDSRMGSTTYNKDLVKEFDKLNTEFSDRIKEISGNTEGFKDKGKEGETGDDTLNANKKRSAQSQGAREFRDTDSDKE